MRLPTDNVETGSVTMPPAVMHRNGVTQNTVTTIEIAVAGLPDGQKTVCIRCLDGDAAIVLSREQAAHVANLLTVERKA